MVITIKKVLNGFEKVKSLGPDGWTVELFLEFFDMLGEYLFAMVEEYRLLGKVCGALNETFIGMIPMKDKPNPF